MDENLFENKIKKIQKQAKKIFLNQNPDIEKDQKFEFLLDKIISVNFKENLIISMLKDLIYLLKECEYSNFEDLKALYLILGQEKLKKSTIHSHMSQI